MSLLEKAIQYLRELKQSHASQDYATAGEVWDVLLARYDRDELCGPSAKTPQNTLSTVLLREAGKSNGKIRRVVNSYGKYAYQYVGESNASPRITPAVDNKPIYAPTPSYSPANRVMSSSSAIPQAQEKPEPSQPRPKIMLLEKAIQYLRELKHSHASQDYATAGEVWDALEARYDRDELCGRDAKTPQFTLSTDLLRESRKENGRVQADEVNGHRVYRYNDGSNMTNNVNIRQLCKKTDTSFSHVSTESAAGVKTQNFVIGAKRAIPEFTNIQPLEFIFQGSSVSVLSWTDFVDKFAQKAYATKFGSQLDDISVDDVRGTPDVLRFGNPYCFGQKNPRMLRPHNIIGNLWFDQACDDANNCAKIVCWMMWWCNLEELPVSIKCRGINGTVPSESSALGGVVKAHEAEENALPSPEAIDEMASACTIDISELRETVFSLYPNGFDFSPLSIDTIKNKCGKELDDVQVNSLRNEILERKDGICLLPEMVISKSGLEEMTTVVLGWLKDYGIFSPLVLRRRFLDKLHNLTDDEEEFVAFINLTIAPQLQPLSVVTLCGQRAIATADNAENIVDDLADKFRRKLTDASDAVTVEEIKEEFPALDERFINAVIKAKIPDAIELTLEGCHAWKLLAFFYLPEDFADELSRAIHDIEDKGLIASIDSITTELEANDCYGTTDFRGEYALDDDDVYRDVIANVFPDKSYSWCGNNFTNAKCDRNKGVARQFVDTHHGIFSEDEFFEFVKEFKRKNTNVVTYLNASLRSYAVRLDKIHWISRADFEAYGVLSEEMKKLICAEVAQLLGSRPFLPIGNLPGGVFSSFPKLEINGQDYYWNGYMLASIVELFISEICIVNTEVSPYTLTAMIIPKEANYSGDVVDYVFDSMRKAGFSYSSADAVFDYLYENKVRVMKTDKLMKKIKSYWE